MRPDQAETMRRRDFLRAGTAGLAAGAGGLLACSPGGGASSDTAEGTVSGPEVEWRMVSSFPRSLDILTEANEYMAARLSALTGGNFRLRVYPSGELVPGLQVMDAVQQGTVQAGFTADYYYIGKNPALAFGTSVPFGLNPRQQISWLLHGGGGKLMNEIYSDFGILSFVCGITPTQMGGWYRGQVASLADLRGLRMRIPGMGGEIMTRLGVTVQVLAAGDIYPALERGAIDATEWGGPHDDEKLGFYQVARNYYYPGWWEPGPTLSLLVGREAWDALPPAYQSLVEGAARDALIYTLARYDAEDPSALERITDEHGVTLRRFTDDILEAAARESRDFFEEQAAADGGFRRVYDAWREFRRKSFRYASGNEQAYAQFAYPRTDL